GAGHGIVLALIAPDADSVDAYRTMDRKFILCYVLKPHWKCVRGALLTASIIGLADLLEPCPIKVVLDYVIGSKHMPQWLSGVVDRSFGGDKMAVLHFAAVLVIAIAAAGALASYLEKTLITRVGQSVMYDIRRDLYHHIQRLSLSYHERHKSGDLVSRVTNDVDSVQEFVSSALLDVVVNALTLAGMLLIMLCLNWRFTMIGMVVAPLLFAQVY